MLVVSDDLIDRVDALRDGKSREQFLELAVLLVGELDRVRGDRARLEFVLGMRDQIEAQERRIRELEQVTIGFLRSLEGAQAGWSVSSAYLSPTVTAGTPLAPTTTGPHSAASGLAAAQQAASVQAPPPPVAPAAAVAPVIAPVVAPAQRVQPPAPVAVVQPVSPTGMAHSGVVQPVTPVTPVSPATEPLQQVMVQPAQAPVRESREEEIRRRESLWQEMSSRERADEREDGGVETEITTSPSRKEAGQETPEEAYNRAIFNILWLVAAVLYGFGDTVTSYLVFTVGGAEANPIMKFFLSLGGIPAFVAGKTLIMAGLFALSVFVFSPLRRSGWVIPIIAALGGGYLVVHNLIVLFSR